MASNKNSTDKIYSSFHINFFDKVILNKRAQMINIIKKLINFDDIKSICDIGTTENLNKSSNFIIKNIAENKIFKSISDQEIKDKFFSKTLKKSITDNFSIEEKENMSSDLIISTATIEHVGNEENQFKMIKNMTELSKNYVVLTTPNRFHPIEFHTKIPFIHFLPKKIHRFILNLFGFKSLSLEENLNLLSKNDIIKILGNLKNFDFEIIEISFLGFVSNFVVFIKVSDR